MAPSPDWNPTEEPGLLGSQVGSVNNGKQLSPRPRTCKIHTETHCFGTKIDLP